MSSVSQPDSPGKCEGCETLRLTLAPHNTAWWIQGHPDGPIGPYNTKAEAKTDRRGLLRFERYGDKPGYVTCEKGGA